MEIWTLILEGVEENRYLRQLKEHIWICKIKRALNETVLCVGQTSLDKKEPT